MGKQFVTSIVQLDTFRRALNAVYKDTQTTTNQLEFLRKTANDSGIGIGGLSDSFVKFSASMKSANVPVQQSNELFASLTRAAGSLGLGAERTSLALDALGQIASKGVVSMEELRQQLGDSLPGALSLTAKGLGITDAELVKLVESGNLAARDFFPAFTKGLQELHGEAEGLVPTWERLKNAFTLLAQDAGDSGWAVLLTGALKLLGAVAGSLLLILSALSEGLFTVGRAAIVVSEALQGRGAEAMKWFREEAQKTTDRLNAQGEAFALVVTGSNKQADALAALAPKIKEVLESSEGLTRSQQLSAIAAKLNGDETLNAAAKYVQLSIATATLIKQQENETLNLERVAKARKEEGETLIALAKLRGDEQGILEATLQAAEEYAVATQRIAASKAEELKILEQQLVAQQAKLVADKATADQQEKETQKLRELIKTKQSEVEQTKASTEAAKQELETRQLAAKTYADNSARIAEYSKRVAELAAQERDLVVQQKSGADVQVQLALVRKQLAEATALQRDAIKDIVTNMRLETAEQVASLQVKQSALGVDVQIAQASANIARLRGDNTRAMQLEREAMAKQIEIAKIKLEIDRVQAQLQIEILKISKAQLSTDDALYAQKVKEIDLKIKLQEVTLRELDGAGRLIKLKEEENRLRQQATNDLGSEAVARGNVTEASEKQADAMAKMLMQYTMSADYSERQIALLEKEAAAEEKLAEARRKRLNVDKEGYSLNTAGERIMAGETQEQIDRDIARRYGEENIGNPDAIRARGIAEMLKFLGSQGGQIRDPGESKRVADARRELQELEARLLNSGPRAGGTNSGDSTTTGGTTPSGRGSSSSGGISGGRNLTVNIGGRQVGTISGLNEQQSRETLAVLRGLENAQGTAA